MKFGLLILGAILIAAGYFDVGNFIPLDSTWLYIAGAILALVGLMMKSKK